MQDPIRPISTAITVQSFPRKAKTAPLRTEEALDAKQRQAKQRETETTSADQEKVTLHDLIPPELLNIPQVITGKSLALASYVANQGAWNSDNYLVPSRDSSSPEVSNTVNRQAISGPDSKQDNLPASALPSRTGMLLSGENKATVDASYRLNNDEPVYVAVPDAVIAMSGQTSKLKALTENISNNVKNAYYRLMTMVPYSVGMLINVFA